MAAADFGADWVLNSDADEFWWPWGGDLKRVLAQIPERYGIVHTFVRPFLPRSGEGGFPERMTIRLAPRAPINNPSSPFRVNVRLLHRASEDVVVGDGNASVRATALAPLKGWSPVEVLHFPVRSFEQFERKFLTHYRTAGERRRGDHLRANQAAQRGRMRELYEEVCVDDERLRRGIDDGSFAVDTRLRDALRALADDPASVHFPRRGHADEVDYAVESTVLQAGELVRAQRRVDDLAARVRRLEKSRQRR
jgi:hypothetical protein